MQGRAPRNADERTVADFGAEWQTYSQEQVPDEEMRRMFASYFHVFPWDRLPPDAVGFDMGVGSGRWARLVAPRVGHLHCIDASAAALEVARRNLAGLPNCSFHHASVDENPLPDGSMDFGYSLGVLHHVPDMAAGVAACTRKLKPGAPFLVYAYYAFDQRPAWFRAMWRASDLVRRGISRLPHGVKLPVTRAVAAGVYWPLARTACLLERAGVEARGFPLYAYRRSSFYSMQTDALDRFGTRLEHRVTREELRAMMSAAGLVDITFSDRIPYWCAVGYRA